MFGKSVEMAPPARDETQHTSREQDEVRYNDVQVNLSGYPSKQDSQFQRDQTPQASQPSHFQGQSGPDAPEPTGASAAMTAGGYQSRPWHYSLCVCCQDMDSCCETWLCTPCQQSRQCNMFTNNESAIHWPYCLLLTFLDPLCGLTLVSGVFACQTRRLARERYGISGTAVGDCCTGWCCRVCNTQQILLEMTVMNDFPGATCYSAAAQPMECHMS